VSDPGRVIGRTDCDTCFDDHFLIQCNACGEVLDHYLTPDRILCRCGADVTPTAEQEARWERYEFDEEDEGW
jgi:hypothetical protein